MPLVSPLRPEDPRRLGDYSLTGRLSAGGQGVVFLGVGPSRSPVAVKLLNARLSGGAANHRRVTKEVETVRRVAPFCTARVLDAGIDDDRLYIVSEYVEGLSLQDHVAEHGPRAGGTLDRLAVGTATALAAIHRAGVVHRDFKPGNVLLGDDGPRVIDFGISRLADATPTGGRPVGTPAYLAPEQLRGDPAGPPADMFSWALTMAYAASGRHAFTADTYAGVLARILYGTPDLGPIDGTLRQVVVACLAGDPEDRPTAEEVLSRLLGRAPSPETAPTEIITTVPGAAPRTAAVQDTGHGTVSAADAVNAPPVVLSPPSAGGRVSRRARAFRVTLTLVTALALTGLAVWAVVRETAFSYDGVWSGSARYPAAKRVFPVEITLTAPGRMRWGADLHCRGRLTRTRETGRGLTLRLDRVTGDECYPGTVTITPRSDQQAAFAVVRTGENAPRYSGTLSRAP
ncbi:serine/threonine-protein kinase [Microbispora sp. NPDC049125]|uniref:serine/threonine-protein kinase n=1 Tax=Microbispora sp. NPDC049125 TaxID=3154929 RepID=UPI00346696D3